MKSTFNPCVRLFEEVSVSWSLPMVVIAEIKNEVREETLTISQALLPLRESRLQQHLYHLGYWEMKETLLSCLLQREPPLSLLSLRNKNQVWDLYLSSLLFLTFLLLFCWFCFVLSSWDECSALRSSRVLLHSWLWALCSSPPLQDKMLKYIP